MVPVTPPSEGLYEASLRQGQVKHALKTALACCVAAGLSYFFHLPSGQLAPVFAYLLLTMGMPSPRLNWLLAQLVITVSALGSALILVAFRDAHFLYLAVTLAWVFTCLLFSNWFALPATLGAMVSALGLFVFFQGTVGDALRFFVAYGTRLANYLQLTRPRLSAMVLLTVAAGAVLASGGAPDRPVLTNTLIGAALVAAGASVLNQ